MERKRIVNAISSRATDPSQIHQHLTNLNFVFWVYSSETVTTFNKLSNKSPSVAALFAGMFLMVGSCVLIPITRRVFSKQQRGNTRDHFHLDAQFHSFKVDVFVSERGRSDLRQSGKHVVSASNPLTQKTHWTHEQAASCFKCNFWEQDPHATRANTLSNFPTAYMLKKRKRPTRQFHRKLAEPLRIPDKLAMVHLHRHRRGRARLYLIMCVHHTTPPCQTRPRSIHQVGTKRANPGEEGWVKIRTFGSSLLQLGHCDVVSAMEVVCAVSPSRRARGSKEKRNDDPQRRTACKASSG